jgi:hypothetical protein
MAYDLEQFITDVQTLCAAQLNTKIAALNSEKNDSIVLASIDSSAYVVQSFDAETVNWNPFVFIGVNEIKDMSEPIRGASATDVKVVVAIVLEDASVDVQVWKRMFRYGRALKEIFEDNFDGIGRSIKLSVQSQVPIELPLLNDSFTHKAMGVMLSANFG